MRASSWLLSSAALVLSSCGTQVGLDERANPPAAVLVGDASECDSSRFPWYRPDPLSCCVDGTDEWFIIGGTSGRLNNRTEGNACTTNGVIPCRGTGCKFGPCGAMGITTYGPPAHVFVPLSAPTVCGRQATGLPGFPEDWTAAAEDYSGLPATCRFNDCGPNGPVMRISVTAVVNGATGTVESIPDAILITGAGTAEFPFEETDPNFIAEPLGPHARATFTDGCVATGKYGSKAYCKQLARVLLPSPTSAPHPITVTYDCEPGFTCQN
jgi:hypothetical protein